MNDQDDKERAERLAGRFDEQETASVQESEKKVLSMKIPDELYNRVQDKYEEIFVEYVKETESGDLQKQDFYEALIEAGLDTIGTEDVTGE